MCMMSQYYAQKLFESTVRELVHSKEPNGENIVQECINLPNFSNERNGSIIKNSQEYEK